MKLNRTRILMLSAATYLSCAMLFAQTDSMGTPQPQQQTNQPGQPGQPQQLSPPSIQDSGPNAGDTGQLAKDRMFLRGAAESGIAEVKLSQLALEKSSSDDVKTFARTMVDDHTKLGEALSRIADSMGIMLPKAMNKSDQAAYDKLQTLSSSDFDTAYLTLMVKGHHRALREFRLESNLVTDPALSDAVANGKHIIHEHLVSANRLAREKGIPLPEHGGKSAPPPSVPAAAKL